MLGKYLRALYVPNSLLRKNFTHAGFRILLVSICFGNLLLSAGKGSTDRHVDRCSWSMPHFAFVVSNLLMFAFADLSPIPPLRTFSAGYVASLPQPSFLSTRSWCKPRSYYYCYHHHHHHLHHHHYHHYLHDIININMCIIYIIIDILWSLLSLLLLAVHGRTQRWVGNEHKMNT